jgi:hypothetical protein
MFSDDRLSAINVALLLVKAVIWAALIVWAFNVPVRPAY